MRNFVILGTLVATTAVAAAEPPGLTASAEPAPAPAPQASIGVTSLFGGDIGIDGQLALEGGYQLDRVWSLHALAGIGGAGDDQGGGTISQERVGVEAKSCTTHRIACAYGGLDVGYQSFTWHGDPYHMSPDEPHHDMIAVARAGFDVGGRHVRFRPGIETYSALAGDTRGVGPFSLIGINLTAGMAYQW